MIRVVLVDDEALTLEVHRTYISRIDGFEVIGECSGARAAIGAILDLTPDLVLLDMTMPDGTGLDVLRHVRARGATADAIAVTAVRDLELVRQMAALGTTQYLVKPYTFATFAERLEHFRSYRERTATVAGHATQTEIDALLGAMRPALAADVPKGLSRESLERVSALVRTATSVSAAEAAAELGMSRVTARRYLEHLADIDLLERTHRYGRAGRPEVRFAWRA